MYWACSAFEDSCNLSDPLGDGLRLKGVRLPELARHLPRTAPSELASDYWHLLRACLFARGVTAEPLEERFREALLDDPDDEAAWAAYSDWLQERGHAPAGLTVLEMSLRSLADLADPPHEVWDAVRVGSVRQAHAALMRVMAAHPRGRPPDHETAKTLVRVSEHTAEFCWHVGRMFGERDLYHQWLFFDDRWAAAHPALANSILRYTRCWDMLSPDGPSDEEG